MPGPKAILTLHSTIGGTNQGPIPFLTGNRHRRRLDGRDKFEFTAADGPWRLDVRRRVSVVKVELPYAGTFWWRVFGMKHGKGPQGASTVTLTCEPLSLILRDAGRMRVQEVEGGPWKYSLGSKSANARFYLETFAIPQVHRRGATWFTLGDVEDDTTLLSLEWYGKTGQWLLEEIKKATGLEQQIEHVSPTSHVLHLRKRVGEDADEVLVADGRNLLSALITQTGQGFASVAQGFGLTPAGSTERSSLALAAWRVAGSNTGTDQVTVEDRAGNDPPDLQPDQSAGLYLRAIDGTLYEILSTTVTTTQNVFQLEAGGAAHFTVDDDVEIRADADGGLRDELVDPTVDSEGVTEAFESDFYRGERNYALNPFGTDHSATAPDSLPALSDGFHAPQAANVSVRGIVPSNRLIPAGSVITTVLAPATEIMQTQADQTAASGEATFLVDPVLPPNNPSGAGPLPDGSLMAIYTNPSNLPNRWSTPQAGTPETPIVARYPTGLADLVGTAVLHTGGSEGLYTVSGLSAYEGTPDGEIYPGDILIGPEGTFVGGFEGTRGWGPIVARATVVGDEAQVLVGRNSSQMSLALVNGTYPVTIYRLRIPGDRPQPFVTVLVSRRLNQGTGGITLAPQVDTDNVVVSPIPGVLNALVVVELTVRGAGGLQLSGSLVAPRIEVFDGGVLIGSAAPDAPLNFNFQSFTAPGFFGAPPPATPTEPNPIVVDIPLVLKLKVPIDVERDISVRVHGAAMNTTGFLGQFFTVIRSFNVQVGSEDESAGPSWPSHANLIHQDTNRRLQIARQLTEEWGFEVVEFWKRFVSPDTAVRPDEPQITLGGDLFVRTSLNANQGIRFRFTEVDHSLDDPGDTRFKALSRVIEAMELINRAIRGRGDRGAGSVAGGTRVLPGSGSSGGTGGSGAAGTGSIFLGRSDARPRPNHRGDYLHQQDTLEVVQWFGNAWDEIIEATRGDERMATTRGAELAMCFEHWVRQDQGWTFDDNGVPALAPPPES